MARPPIVWVLPDPHFYHFKLEDTGYRPKGFTELISNNLKELVKKQDLLIVLGDVIFRDKHKLSSLLPDEGTKVLTMGNHDKQSRWWYMRNGFHVVVDTFTMGDVMFSHVPQRKLPAGINFNVHGHLHRHRPMHDIGWYDTGTYKSMVLEGSNYKPKNLAKILHQAKLTQHSSYVVRSQQVED